MSTIHVGITGIGHQAGEIILTNEDVADIVNTAVRNKKERSTGSRELTPEEEKKHLCDAQWLTGRQFYYRVHTKHTTTDMGVDASINAMEMAGVGPNNIDAVAFDTVSPDRNFSPTCAQLTIARLGIPARNGEGLRFILPADIHNTCTSVASGITLAWTAIKAGLVKRVLVIGADKMSTTVDPADRNFFPLMGDAGTAIIMEAVTESNDSFPWQERSFFNTDDPVGVNNIIAIAGGSAMPLTPEMLIGDAENPLEQRPDKLWQDGATVHKHMIKYLSDPTVPPNQTVYGAGLARVGLTFKDIQAIYPHQASVRMNGEVLNNLKKLGFKGRMSDNGRKYGNTTSAAVLLGVSLDVQKGILTHGQVIALNAFGAGYTASMIFVRWTANVPCPV